ncbi:MAG TPA: Gfo/Idh/MocA family oxidoreductase [Gammaproteobacteria bacterium]|nr:Gfo/Idh/MocA family oxidoreductase [Gammaproteobacteria bacterium]
MDVEMRPRLGFLGLGWIGRHRMQCLAASDSVEIAALADTAPDCLAEARKLAPDAQACTDYDALLDLDLDGIVIATPSALHADQSQAALKRDRAVFCQKPLGRSGTETARVVACAQARDRLLGVDFSYRYLKGVASIRERIANGDLGEIYAATLTFHNAYGPDKPWFYRRASAGGGCVTDLGIHLIDLALWLLGDRVEQVSSRCYAGGQLLAPDTDKVEDYASIRLTLGRGTCVDIACSWRLPLGRDCDIQLAFYGTRAGMALKNVNGSFYDFRTELYRGTATEVLHEPVDENGWGGRAVIAWAHKLGECRRFDEAIAPVVTVAEIIDQIYGNGEGAYR